MISYRTIVGFLNLLLLAGCIEDFPRDSNHSLDRIRREGIMVVGVIENAPYSNEKNMQLIDDERELAQRFAAHLEIRAEFQPLGYETAIEKLEEGQIDLLIGGLRRNSPGAEYLGLTRPYRTLRYNDEILELVMAVPPGENQLLTTLERFLAAEANR